MVEVGEYDLQSLADFTQRVGDWHADFVESYICGAGGAGVARLDGLGLQTFTTRDKDGNVTFRSAASDGEEVGESTVGDPSVQTTLASQSL